MESVQYVSLAYAVLPPQILDWFDLTKIEEEITDPTFKELYVGEFHIYLDERDNRSDGQQSFRPNGFTEETRIRDFPIRDRRVTLHIRRRRWIDEDGHNILIDTYPLMAKGFRCSEEFAAFLKETAGYIPGNSPVGGSQLGSGRTES